MPMVKAYRPGHKKYSRHSSHTLADQRNDRALEMIRASDCQPIPGFHSPPFHSTFSVPSIRIRLLRTLPQSRLEIHLMIHPMRLHLREILFFTQFVWCWEFLILHLLFQYRIRSSARLRYERYRTNLFIPICTRWRFRRSLPQVHYGKSGRSGIGFER